MSLIEKVIRDKIIEFDNWNLQSLCFDLLKQFYEKYISEYDSVKLAESFIKYTPNFYVDVVEAYVFKKNWEKVIETINMALNKVELEVVKTFLKETLIDCYENLFKFEKALNAAENLFYEKATYYCGVIKDILAYIKNEQEFNMYYDNLITANKRRPVLRDEMKKRIGR